MYRRNESEEKGKERIWIYVSMWPYNSFTTVLFKNICVWVCVVLKFPKNKKYKQESRTKEKRSRKWERDKKLYCLGFKFLLFCFLVRFSVNDVIKCWIFFLVLCFCKSSEYVTHLMNDPLISHWTLRDVFLQICFFLVLNFKCS